MSRPRRLHVEDEEPAETWYSEFVSSREMRFNTASSLLYEVNEVISYPLHLCVSYLSIARRVVLELQRTQHAERMFPADCQPCLHDTPESVERSA